MSFCPNPGCRDRGNDDAAQTCRYCRTPLQIRDRYRLVRPLRSLKRTAFTEVFEASDLQSSKLKVIKLLNFDDPKLDELIGREARALRKIKHPGVPRCEPDGFFTLQIADHLELRCLVIEKLEGQDLLHWLEQHDRLDQTTAIDWLRQLVEILDAVHGSGFFHRDIKPSNIILQPDGKLALIDFGGVCQITKDYLARISRGLTEDYLSGQDLTVIRTLGYSPPEQLGGKPLPQSDFFALGHTFVHLTTGIEPYRLLDDLNLSTLIWRDRARQIQKPVADFIDWLQHPAPGQRPQNTKVILQVLDESSPSFRGMVQALASGEWSRLRSLKTRIKLWQLSRSPIVRTGFGALVAATAIATYQLVSVYATTKDVNYYLEQGAAHLDQGDYQSAKEDYQQVVKRQPNSLVTINTLAGICYSLEDLQCALENYARVLEGDPRRWETLFNLGKIYDDQKDYPRAIENYGASIRYGGVQSFRALNNLARLQILQGNYAEASKLVEQGLASKPKKYSRGILLGKLGWIAFKQKDYAKAITYLTQSTELSPDKPSSYCLLAQTLEAQGKQQEAQPNWLPCLSLESTNSEVVEWREIYFRRMASESPFPVR